MITIFDYLSDCLPANLDTVEPLLSGHPRYQTEGVREREKETFPLILQVRFEPDNVVQPTHTHTHTHTINQTDSQ